MTLKVFMDVSILVVMDHLQMVETDFTPEDLQHVSILVVMDHLQMESDNKVMKSINYSLNPCCNGSSPNGQFSLTECAGFFCLNPCCNGSSPNGAAFAFLALCIACLNPCCNGSSPNGPKGTG